MGDNKLERDNSPEMIALTLLPPNNIFKIQTIHSSVFIKSSFLLLLLIDIGLKNEICTTLPIGKWEYKKYELIVASKNLLT